MEENQVSDITKYAITEEDAERLECAFTYHAPKDDQGERYVHLRDAAKGLAKMMLQLTPASRERSLAITKLEESVMWANAGIARNE